MRDHEHDVEVVAFAPLAAYAAIRELAGIPVSNPFSHPSLFVLMTFHNQNTDRSRRPGMYLASGARDKTVKLWDTSSGQMLRNFVSLLHLPVSKLLNLIFLSPATTTGYVPSHSTHLESIYSLHRTTRPLEYGSFRPVAASRPLTHTITLSPPLPGEGSRPQGGLLQQLRTVRMATWQRTRKSSLTLLQLGASTRRSRSGYRDL